MGSNVTTTQRKPIDYFEKSQSSLLVLTRYNDTARAIRAMFHRRLPIWEGQLTRGRTRPAGCHPGWNGQCRGNRHGSCCLSWTMSARLQSIGLRRSTHPRSNGGLHKVDLWQAGSDPGAGSIADHRARSSWRVEDASSPARDEGSAAFGEITEFDLSKEFLGSCSSGDYESPWTLGLPKSRNRRTYTRPSPPARAIQHDSQGQGASNARASFSHQRRHVSGQGRRVECRCTLR